MNTLIIKNKTKEYFIWLKMKHLRNVQKKYFTVKKEPWQYSILSRSRMTSENWNRLILRATPKQLQQIQQESLKKYNIKITCNSDEDIQKTFLNLFESKKLWDSQYWEIYYDIHNLISIIKMHRDKPWWYLFKWK